MMRSRVPTSPGPSGLLAYLRHHSVAFEMRGTTLEILSDLSFVDSDVRDLSSPLIVHGFLDISGSRIQALQHATRVDDDLCLARTRVASLPEGLHVGRDLDLEETLVVRFPQHMFVGGVIFPPPGLEDIHRFMQGVSQDRVLSLQGSRHHIMETRAQLHDFPDLLRVVEASATRYRQVRLHPTLNGRTKVFFEGSGP